MTTFSESIHCPLKLNTFFSRHGRSRGLPNSDITASCLIGTQVAAQSYIQDLPARPRKASVHLKSLCNCVAKRCKALSLLSLLSHCDTNQITYLSPRSRNSTHRHSLSGPSPMKMKATWPKNAKDMYPGSPLTKSYCCWKLAA